MPFGNKSLDPSPFPALPCIRNLLFFSYPGIGTIRSQQILGEQPMEMGLAKLMSLEKAEVQ